jgi:hypothetical protein
LAPVLSLQHIIFPIRGTRKGLSGTPFQCLVVRVVDHLIPSFHIDLEVLL